MTKNLIWLISFLAVILCPELPFLSYGHWSSNDTVNGTSVEALCDVNYNHTDSSYVNTTCMAYDEWDSNVSLIQCQCKEQ